MLYERKNEEQNKIRKTNTAEIWQDEQSDENITERENENNTYGLIADEHKGAVTKKGDIKEYNEKMQQNKDVEKNSLEYLKLNYPSSDDEI